MNFRGPKAWMFALAVLAAATPALGQRGGQGDYLPEDVTITGRQMHSFSDANEPVAVVLGDFSLTIGRRSIAARDAVLWVSELPAGSRVLRQITVYAEGDVTVTEPDGTSRRDPAILINIRQEGALRADVGRHVEEPLTELPLYKRAKAVRQGLEPLPTAPPPPGERVQTRPVRPAPAKKEPFVPQLRAQERPLDFGALETVRLRYRELHGYQYSNEAGQAQRVVIARGDVYLGGQGPKDIGFMEMRADAAVLFTAPSSTLEGERPADFADRPGGERVTEVYLEGDVRIQVGERSMRADRVVYDLVHQQAVMLDAVVEFYDPQRNIPIVFRADRAVQINRREFEFNHARVSTSEFRTPSFDISASRVRLKDQTAYDEAGQPVGERQYQIDMRNTTFNVAGVPILYWPRASLDASMTEAPLRSLSVGTNGEFGAGATSKWDVFRSLGLREPEGVKSTFIAEGYEQETAFGLDADYDRSSTTGLVRSQYMWDWLGKDDFGFERQDVPAPEHRGRLLWRQKQFLSEDWQIQVEASYLSDKNFLEAFYRQEFWAGKEQETLIYAEKQRDDWAITALVKGQINDFQPVSEAYPDLGAHKIGASAIEDKLTLFGEAHAGAVKLVSGDDPNVPNSETTGRFVVRGEADAPMHWGPLNVAPYTFGQPGYWSEGPGDDKNVARVLGGGGLRANTHLWRVYDGAHSRIFDIDRMRHVVTPEVLVYGAADNLPPSSLFPFSPDIETPRAFEGTEFGVRQRWQTYRGNPDSRHVVDFARLDVMADIFNDAQDVHEPADGRMFGRRPEYSIGRNALNADGALNISDATSVLSRMNYDLNDRDLAIGDLGVAVMREPRLRYYAGVRYIQDYNSAVGTFGVNYQVNEKYQLDLFQQSDFAFQGGQNLVTEVSIVRRFPRWYGAVSVVVNRATNEVGAFVTVWPEGAPEFHLSGTRLGSWATSLLN